MSTRSDKVDAYISRASDFAQPILLELREAVHAGSSKLEEALKWGAPSFLYQGKILCMMAAFKQHCAFGFWHPAMRERVVSGMQREIATGPFVKVTDLPPRRVIKQLVKQAVQLVDDGVEVPRVKKPKKRLIVPKDLQAALAKSRRARETFDKLSPSKRKDYVDWIVEAKRPETKVKRIRTAIEWLAEGKSLNWKYER